MVLNVTNINDLLETYEELKKPVPLCSYEDCHKVKFGGIWIDAEYNSNYKNYSHSVCDDCKPRMYE